MQFISTAVKKINTKLDYWKFFIPTFFCCSLIKEEMERPKYKQLLQDPFILRAQNEQVNVAAYVSEIMDEMANNGISAFTTNQP